MKKNIEHFDYCLKIRHLESNENLNFEIRHDRKTPESTSLELDEQLGYIRYQSVRPSRGAWQCSTLVSHG